LRRKDGEKVAGFAIAQVTRVRYAPVAGGAGFVIVQVARVARVRSALVAEVAGFAALM
jgi:hypothetical protein